MSTLKRTQSGLLFHDDFKEKTLLWHLSPYNKQCLSFEEDGLHIKHNENYITFTIAEPEENEYTCICKLDHVPVNRDDIAGIIVFNSNKFYAECQTYMADSESPIYNFGKHVGTETIGSLSEKEFVTYRINDGTETEQYEEENIETVENEEGFIDVLYKYLKFNKTNNTYQFFASPNGIKWIEVGNVKFPTNGVIGIFLYAIEDENFFKMTPGEYTINYNDKDYTFNIPENYTIKSFIQDNTYVPMQQELANDNTLVSIVPNEFGIKIDNIFYDYEKLNMFTWPKCTVNYFALYKSKYLVFDNIPERFNFSLSSGENIIFRSDWMVSDIKRIGKTVTILTDDIVFPIENAKIILYDGEDFEDVIATYDLSDIKIYGGDIFTLAHEIELYLDQTLIPQEELIDLGTIVKRGQVTEFKLKNKDISTVYDMSIRLIEYSDYYNGSEFLEIAYSDNQVDITDIDELEFAQELTVNRFTARGGYLYLRNKINPHQGFYTAVTDDYRFKIEIK